MVYVLPDGKFIYYKTKLYANFGNDMYQISNSNTPTNIIIGSCTFPSSSNTHSVDITLNIYPIVVVCISSQYNNIVRTQGERASTTDLSIISFRNLGATHNVDLYKFKVLIHNTGFTLKGTSVADIRMYYFAIF